MEVSLRYKFVDRKTTGKKIICLLMPVRLADLFERDISILANLESLDNGKPFNKAVFEVHGCAAVFRYFAGWCDKSCGKTIPSDGSNFVYTRKGTGITKQKQTCK